MTLAPKITDLVGSATSTSASRAQGARTTRSRTLAVGTEATLVDPVPLATFSDAKGSPDLNDFTAALSWVGPGQASSTNGALGPVDSPTSAAQTGSFPFTAVLATFTDASGLPDVNDFAATIIWSNGQGDTQTTAEDIEESKALLCAADSPAEVAQESDLPLAVPVEDTDTSVGSSSPLPASCPADLSPTQLSAEPSIEPIVPQRAGDSPSAPLPRAGEPPRALTFTPPTATQGVVFRELLLTFTAENANPDGTDFTALVSWGDGSVSTLSAANGGIQGTSPFCVIGEHTYTQAGPFTLAVQVLDRGEASTSTSACLNVRPAPVPQGDVASHTVLVDSSWSSSVIDVSPSMAADPPDEAAPPPFTSPLLPPVPPVASPRPAQGLTQEQVSDLVFQMGVASPMTRARTVSPAVLYDHMASHPAAKARIVQVQDQIFLNVSQTLAAKQQAKAASGNQPSQGSPPETPPQTEDAPKE